MLWDRMFLCLLLPDGQADSQESTGKGGWRPHAPFLPFPPFACRDVCAGTAAAFELFGTFPLSTFALFRELVCAVPSKPLLSSHLPFPHLLRSLTHHLPPLPAHCCTTPTHCLPAGMRGGGTCLSMQEGGHELTP